MNICKRNLLLACHLFYDLTLAAWLEFCTQIKSSEIASLEILEQKIPFTKLDFRPRPDLEQQANCWEQALCHSQKYQNRITLYDESYPTEFELLAQKPLILYQQGTPIPKASELIAIVGTRKYSNFGFSNAHSISTEIAQRGFGIVSGLAKGIDTIAHKCANQSNRYTLAVLGSGLEQIYPKENQKLAANILAQNGTLLSPFPPKTKPYPYNFPRRNQWIAALSAGVMVIEGAEKSGAAITARAAMEIGKTAVVFPQDFRKEFGRGAIQLIRDGAYPAKDVKDAITAIAFPYGGKLFPQTKIEIKNKRTFTEWNLQDFSKTLGLAYHDALALIEKLRQERQVEYSPFGSYLIPQEIIERLKTKNRIIS